MPEMHILSNVTRIYTTKEYTLNNYIWLKEL